jgi:RNA polymerase sigma factor (sigma-70 family)
VPTGQTSDLGAILNRLANSRDDEAAWELLYRKLWPLVMAVIYRILGGRRDLAADASQEVFLRLLRYCKFDQFRDPDAFKAYVYVMCRNVAVDFLSQLARTSEIVTPEPYAESPGSGVETINPELIEVLRQQLREVLSELNEPDRRIVQLLIDGFSITEIAAQTGMSYSTVATRLHRMRRRSRNKLK